MLLRKCVYEKSVSKCTGSLKSSAKIARRSSRWRTVWKRTEKDPVRDPRVRVH